MFTYWLCMSFMANDDGTFQEKEFEDVTLFKKIEFPQPLHVGDTVWFEIDSAEVVAVNHYLLPTETAPAHTQVEIRMNNVYNMETFRHFWTKTTDWVDFPHH